MVDETVPTPMERLIVWGSLLVMGVFLSVMLVLVLFWTIRSVEGRDFAFRSESSPPVMTDVAGEA